MSRIALIPDKYDPHLASGFPTPAETTRVEAPSECLHLHQGDRVHVHIYEYLTSSHPEMMSTSSPLQIFHGPRKRSARHLEPRPGKQRRSQQSVRQSASQPASQQGVPCTHHALFYA